MPDTDSLTHLIRLGPKSKKWLQEAVDLTRPASWRGTVLCNDDCENCPLYLRGCAGNCTRWDDSVCANCPCLASIPAAQSEHDGLLNTVDPSRKLPDGTEPDAPPQIEVGKNAQEAN